MPSQQTRKFIAKALAHDSETCVMALHVIHGPVAKAAPADLYLETLRALFAPKRLIPIFLVTFSLIMLQERMSRTVSSIVIGFLMCAAFVLIAPAAWRYVEPMVLGRSEGATALTSLLGAVSYGALGIAVVSLLGVAVPHYFSIAITLLTTPASLVVCVALFWVGGWGLARDIEMELQMAHEKARSEELQKVAKHAELLALRQHLDPHFLFNTLNAIAEWCRDDPRVAERAILELGSVLRTVMQAIKKPLWPLEDELNLMLHVFSLHSIRDPERFSVVTELDPALREISVPPMLLLPLAENAMKHGPESGHRGEVIVRSRAREGSVEIELSNPGPFAGRRVGGEGLSHVEERLKLVYDAKASLSIEPAGEVRTIARVVFPREQTPGAKP
jgi:two-component system, LytTR family, sensor histidine kinase AlgZ